MNLFDSHLHLTSPQFSDEEIIDLLKRGYNQGISSVMNVATDSISMKRSERLAKTVSQINWYQAGATPPQDAHNKDAVEFFQEVERYALEFKVLQAIGETGLDYYYGEATKEEQRALFDQYIDLAKRADLPLIIHCRNAFSDFFSMIRSQGSPRGVLHCFTGSEQDAKQLLDLGWYISFSGIITYHKSAQEVQKVARFVPLEFLVIETDAPYLAPVPKRGKKNEPAFLFYTAQCLAELKGISYKECIDTTYYNAKKLFGT